jgi:hypothetical protein
MYQNDALIFNGATNFIFNFVIFKNLFQEFFCGICRDVKHFGILIIKGLRCVVVIFK